MAYGALNAPRNLTFALVLPVFAACSLPSAAAPVKILALGDSLTAGYGLPEALRITIGTGDQNRAIVDALSEFAAL